MNTLKKLLSHLTFYVLIAIISGILLGHYIPQWGIKLEFIGNAFISIIKVFIKESSQLYVCFDIRN